MYNRWLCLSCSGCVAACNAGAFAMREDGVFVDRRLCTGCGDCAAACPANAMRLAGTVFSIDELVEKP